MADTARSDACDLFSKDRNGPQITFLNESNEFNMEVYRTPQPGYRWVKRVAEPKPVYTTPLRSSDSYNNGVQNSLKRKRSLLMSDDDDWIIPGKSSILSGDDHGIKLVGNSGYTSGYPSESPNIRPPLWNDSMSATGAVSDGNIDFDKLLQPMEQAFNLENLNWVHDEDFTIERIGDPQKLPLNILDVMRYDFDDLKLAPKRSFWQLAVKRVLTHIVVPEAWKLATFDKRESVQGRFLVPEETRRKLIDAMLILAGLEERAGEDAARKTERFDLQRLVNKSIIQRLRAFRKGQIASLRAPKYPPSASWPKEDYQEEPEDFVDDDEDI